jgi:hypothetical protein
MHANSAAGVASTGHAGQRGLVDLSPSAVDGEDEDAGAFCGSV